MRGIEIEVPDQSDVIPAKIAKEKKPSVQKIIDDLPPCSEKYVPMNISFRPPRPHHVLREKTHTPFSLFSLFFSSSLLQMIAEHTNIQADLKRSQADDPQGPWSPARGAEIGAFFGILLYMGYARMPRVEDYWATNLTYAFHHMIISCMGRIRWQQIKRYLKISHPIEVDQNLNTRGADWWKKLEPLATEFRNASKKYWVPGSHVSVDEQLIGFKGRCMHAMQLACKAAGVGFKIYSICQENYLIDFLFTSKVGLCDVEFSTLMLTEF